MKICRKEKIVIRSSIVQVDRLCARTFSDGFLYYQNTENLARGAAPYILNSGQHQHEGSRGGYAWGSLSCTDFTVITASVCKGSRVRR